MMEKKIDTRDLRLGMYVSNLDRPWVETPFLFQGFSLDKSTDIQLLKAHCRFVYIDIDKGEDGNSYLESYADAGADAAVREICRRPNGQDFYPDSVPMEEELETARVDYRKAQETLTAVLDDARSGRELSLNGVNASVDGMIDSVLRNPDAFLWLTQLEQKDVYAYAHALNACTLSVAFGRHMGFPKAELRHIAVGSLLFDIGKMKLPKELLDKPGKLSDEEFALIKEHVNFGVRMLNSNHGFHRASLEVLQSHHERFDGSGYPFGNKGAAIPVYGRMAAIVDCYSAITCKRPYRAGISPHQAVRNLYEWRGVDFQPELVEQFIQCLGVYPTGTLVELNSGEIGIIVAQNRMRRLRPKVMVILDQARQQLAKPTTVDLLTNPELEIAGAVEADAIDIDPNEYYL